MLPLEMNEVVFFFRFGFVCFYTINKKFEIST